jgi:hypothetical protein
MQEYGSLPRARQDGLLEEAVGEELLLYDRDSHTAHCLSPTAASVWRHCDGEHDLAELAVLAGVSEGLVTSALYELREKDLLDAEPALTQSTIPGESRREAIGRVARYGAAAAAGSMVVSATASTPAMASSKSTLCCQCEQTGTKRGCILCANLPVGKTCLTYCETTFGVTVEGFLTGQTCQGTGCM